MVSTSHGRSAKTFVKSMKILSLAALIKIKAVPDWSGAAFGQSLAACAVIISHDRWFLDRIATHILAFEGDSHVEWFEGNFQDYEADKMRRLGTDSVIPHRLKYKKFKR